MVFNFTDTPILLPMKLTTGISLIAVMAALGWATTGCGPMERTPEQAEQIKKEMEGRELKHVTSTQIIEKAREKGQAITEAAQKTLLQTLLKKVETEGIVGTLEYCNLNALPLIDSLSTAHKTSIRRVSNKWRNPKDAPTADEQDFMDAYAYTVEQGQSPREEVFMEDNATQVIYTRPIMLGAGLCLQCHGQEDKDIAPETLAKIKTLYPDDKATGYQLGEWRGIWKVTFEKKDLVMGL